jgi:hypothetical protein
LLKPYQDQGYSLQGGEIGPFRYSLADLTEHQGQVRRTYRVWTTGDARLPALGPWLVDDETFFNNAVNRTPEDAVTVMNGHSGALGEFLRFTARNNFVPPTQAANQTLSATLPLELDGLRLIPDDLMSGYARAQWTDPDGTPRAKSIPYSALNSILASDETTTEIKATSIRDLEPTVPDTVRDKFASLTDAEFLQRCLEQPSMARHPMVRMAVLARVLGPIDYDRMLAAMDYTTPTLSATPRPQSTQPRTTPQATQDATGELHLPDIPGGRSPESPILYRILGLAVFALVAGWGLSMTFLRRPGGD